MSKQEMNNDNNITPLMEQEFAIVDSIITAHTNAAIAKVNAEALQTYWEVGAYISDRLKNAQWGDHVVSELADYLKRHNPKRRGYSKRIDLVFYHRALQCLVAVELKAVDFESEFVSKMDMYLEALDRDYKRPNENPSVGIILCPSADKAEVEYSLCRSMSPTMVAEYKRVLIPREVITRSLAEYCEFLKKEYKQ